MKGKFLNALCKFGMVSVCKYLPFSLVAVIDERFTYAYRAPDHYRVLNIMTVRTKNSILCSYEYIYYLTPPYSTVISSSPSATRRAVDKKFIKLLIGDAAF